MSKYIIPNLRNACRVLKLLADHKDGLTIATITRLLEIPRTTVLRIVTTLGAEGMVNLKENKFSLGTALIHLGTKSLEKIEIRSASVPILAELARATEETAHLAVLSGDKSLLVEVCDSPNPVRVASRAGTFVDLHCSSTGKVFLAWSVPDLASFLDGLGLLRMTDNTLTEQSALLLEAERTRRRGYAMDEEEYSLGVRCMAAPVRNAFGQVVAALGITASTSTFTRKRIKPFAELVTGAADRITAAMGGQRTEPPQKHMTCD